MTKPEILSLSTIESDIWNLLTSGSKHPKAAFYTGILGTQSANGGELRTVILREVNEEEKQICCYTDRRSGKVAEIQTSPSVSWLFWDAEKRIQLRLSGIAAIEINNSFTDQHWAKATPSNRRSYMAIPAPGSMLDRPASGLLPELDAREPTLEESEQGKTNFAVIISTIRQIDWLHLGNKGHRRALFTYEKGKVIKSSWIVP
jgi:pyridoxamine 5'-phosphate oxidase